VRNDQLSQHIFMGNPEWWTLFPRICRLFDVYVLLNIEVSGALSSVHCITVILLKLYVIKLEAVYLKYSDRVPHHIAKRIRCTISMPLIVSMLRVIESCGLGAVS
jgi:hypothetical protein